MSCSSSFGVEAGKTGICSTRRCGICGDFAEYAVNALLELAGARTDRGHDLGNSLETLRAEGWVEGEYAVALGQLEKYRKKADYGSYSRSRSVHYNATNVEQLLNTIGELRAEVEQSLRQQGKLPSDG